MKAETADAIQETPKKSWRDVYKVHEAANLFPMLPENELRELGEDIKQNGLKEPIALWSMEPEDSQSAVVLDGRNRLDAMELVGIETVQSIGQGDKEKYRFAVAVEYLSFATNPASYRPNTGGINPFLYAISKNAYRRHLTKEQRAEMIVQAVKLKTTSPMMARSFNPEVGQRGGSTKDAFKKEVIEESAKHGIGTRTAERAIAKDRGPTQTTRAAPKPSPKIVEKLNAALKVTDRERVVKLTAELEDKNEQILSLYQQLSELRMGQLSFLERIRKDMVKKYHPDRNAGKMFSGSEVMADFNHFCDEIKAAISKVK